MLITRQFSYQMASNVSSQCGVQTYGAAAQQWML
jgi:hypothetical protein